jgi:hypothetical protein
MACLHVTSAARTWAQCAYQAAHHKGESRFMLNYAKAVVLKEKLLPTAKPRWQRLEPLLVKSCGTYAAARARDLRSPEGGSSYTPDDQFMAIFDTSDIEKLVGNHA